MYSAFQLAYKYLHYYFTASSGKGHGIHSPFIFDFITKVLNDKTNYSDYEMAEQLRIDMRQNHSTLSIEDLGAGSRVSKNKQRTISSIARHALKPPKYSQLLYRVARYYHCRQIVELGTSLGITSSYLSLAAGPEGKLITIEGAATVAETAQSSFSRLGLQNIQLHTKSFDEWFADEQNSFSKTDLAFIDGNHQLEPTLKYFNGFLPRIHNNSILVFDDIHWSREMEQAWGQIKAHSSVTCTVDLFFIGLVFFRNEIREKQHFVIRF